MSQRYTPSQLALLVDDIATAEIYPPVGDAALNGLEANTLVLAGEFSTDLASCVIKPWVNVKSKDDTGVKVDNWLPLASVTMTAVANTPKPPPLRDPLRFRAPLTEVALPNCHEVRVELISVSAGTLNLWGATANRAPR